jgi:iron(III) transport system ATP-binding protein
MIDIRNLHVHYQSSEGSVHAVRGINITVEEGQFYTMLGPSGCGKTTTLRCLAGLERPSGGEIFINGEPVFSTERNVMVPAYKRDIGMVFQSYAIWPHMTVFANAAFPLEVRKDRPSKQVIQDKVMGVLAAVQLDHLSERDATRLSGGQQQRLALARALVMEPELLLLDEPLSNLDLKLREAMRFELKRIQRDNGLTTIYVTHDQGEALALSHEIAVMSEGRIVQIGPPRAIYDHPRTKFVADFIGTTNFLEGTVKGEAGSNRFAVDTPIGTMTVASEEKLSSGMPVSISIRPEDIELSETALAAAGDANVYSGSIDATVFLGDFVDVQVKAGSAMLQSRTHPSLSASEGDTVHMRISPDKCVAIEDTVRA